MSGYGGSEPPAAAGMVGGGGGGGGGDAHPSSAKPLEGGAKRGTPHQGLLRLERARTLLGEPQDSSMENVGLRCAPCFGRALVFPTDFPCRVASVVSARPHGTASVSKCLRLGLALVKRLVTHACHEDLVYVFFFDIFPTRSGFYRDIVGLVGVRVGVSLGFNPSINSTALHIRLLLRGTIVSRTKYYW